MPPYPGDKIKKAYVFVMALVDAGVAITKELVSTLAPRCMG